MPVTKDKFFFNDDFLSNCMIFSGLASEGIMAMFERVALNLGKSYMLPRPLNRAGRPYGKVPYYLAGFQTEFTVKSLPLGYRWPSSRPNPQLDCDTEACHHPSHSNIQRLTCGHTFHSPCMSDENGNSLGCIICLRNLTADIQKLSQAWNIRLLSSLNEVEEDGGDGNDDDDDNDGNNSSNPEIPDVPKDHKYFKSPQYYSLSTSEKELIRLHWLSMPRQNLMKSRRFLVYEIMTKGVKILPLDLKNGDWYHFRGQLTTVELTYNLQSKL